MSASPLPNDSPERGPSGASVDLYGRLLGRPPSEEELARFFRVKDALQIHDDDPLLAVIMALEHYTKLHEEIPDAMLRVFDQGTTTLREVLHKERGDQLERLSSLLASLEGRATAEIQGMARGLRQDIFDMTAHAVTEVRDRASVSTVTLLLRQAFPALGLLLCFSALASLFGGILSTGHYPAWASKDAPLLSSLFWAPLGFVAYPLLLPASVYGLLDGWERCQNRYATGRAKLLGVASMFGCSLVLLGGLWIVATAV